MSTDKIKAIATSYNGYYFRSRIEARWAVFMDSLGIKYEYEKEGYDFDGIMYLPDFWLPDLRIWLEIKGLYPSHNDKEKARLLAISSHSNVYILYGAIPDISELYIHGIIVMYAQYYAVEDGEPIYVSHEDDGQRWCECPECHVYGIKWSGQAARLSCECYDGNKDKIHMYKTIALEKAYTAARSARFEFGDSGGMIEC